MSDQPKRIQRQRVRGWKMPANTIYVGRPTKWGNPYGLGWSGTPTQCVELYRKWITANQESAERFMLPLAELRGKNLACWCPLGHPCHADVLLELANAAPPTEGEKGR